MKEEVESVVIGNEWGELALIRAALMGGGSRGARSRD